MGGFDVYCAFCAPYFHGGTNRYSLQDSQHELADVDEASTAWLKELKCIGRNPRVKKPNCFISGTGEDGGYGTVYVSGSQDPNFPWDEETNRFGEGEYVTFSFGAYVDTDLDDSEVAFPFHPACFELFEQVLDYKGGIRPGGSIDKDILYMVMDILSKGSYGQALNVEYGELGASVFEHYFRFFKGIGPWLMNPFAAREGLQSYCENLVPFNLACVTVGQDPFNKLPNELVMEIFELLHIEDIASLCLMSQTAASISVGNAFWKKRLFQDLPWLKGIFPRLDDPVNYWQLCKMLCLASNGTKPNLIKGLANRARIWKTCCVIADQYLIQNK